MTPRKAAWILFSVSLFLATSLTAVSFVADPVMKAEKRTEYSCRNELTAVYKASTKIAAEGAEIMITWGPIQQRQIPRWSGSGVEGSYGSLYGVLTAAHVVRDAVKLEAVDDAESGETRRTLTVLLVDEKEDLAFCTVSGDPRPGCPDLTPVLEVELAETVWYAGCGAGTRKWLEKSIVARPHWSSRTPPQITDGFLVTGRGYYGSSGSAVWVERGRGLQLAGVISQWASDSATYGVGPLAAAGPRRIDSFLRQAEWKYVPSH